jgi:hypothetical protein
MLDEVKTLYYITLSRNRVVLGYDTSYALNMYLDLAKDYPNLYPFEGESFKKLVWVRLLKCKMK